MSHSSFTTGHASLLRWGSSTPPGSGQARDGMMQGVNVEATLAMAQASSIPVIASGGITSIEDIRALVSVADQGICGAITGRAIYEGTLDLAAAQRLCDGAS